MLSNVIFQGKIALTLPYVSVNWLLVLAYITFPLVVACKLLLYGQPSALTFIGVLEGIDGCSVCGCAHDFLQSILYFCIVILIQRICEGRSGDDLVFDGTIIHLVWSSSLDYSDGWYDIIRPKHICQRDFSCSNILVNIVRESFCTFDYRKNIHDVGYFGIIPIFIFFEGLSLQLKVIH